MKRRSILSAVLAGAILGLSAARAEDDSKLAGDVKTAIAAFNTADSNMAKLFKKSAGYVVFPNVGKGGFILGGAHGNGLVYEKGKFVGRASLTQVTVGAQLGGQEFSEVVFFEDAKALADFKTSEFTMNAQVGAVAAAEGVSQNAKYIDGVMVFTRAKQSLMAEASVVGQKFKFEPVKQ